MKKLLPLYARLLSLAIITFSLTGCISYIKLNTSEYNKIQNNDYDGAFADFNLAVSKNKKYWLSYYNRGASYMHGGNYQKAIDDFNSSIVLKKRNPFALDNRGLCKKICGDTLGALKDFKAAYQYNKFDPKVNAHLGKLLAELNQCGEAMKLLNVAINAKAFDDCNTEFELRYLRHKCDPSIELWPYTLSPQKEK
jgi:tetratricopeptide (TPR) repeat protein